MSLKTGFPFHTLFDKVIHCVEQFKVSALVERIELCWCAYEHSSIKVYD